MAPAVAETISQPLSELRADVLQGFSSAHHADGLHCSVPCFPHKPAATKDSFTRDAIA